MTEQQESPEIISCCLNIDKSALDQLFGIYGSVTAFEQVHMEFMRLFLSRPFYEAFSFLLENYPKILIVALVANAIQMQKVLMEALKDKIDTPTEH